MRGSHCRSDQLDQVRSIPITHFYQSNPDQMLDRPSTRALPDRYSIFYDPHPSILDISRFSPRQLHRSLLGHHDLHTINTRSPYGQYSISTRLPRPTRHDTICERSCIERVGMFVPEDKKLFFTGMGADPHLWCQNEKIYNNKNDN